MEKNYKYIDIPSLSEAQIEELEELKIKNDNSIDVDDVPEATSKEFETGTFYYLES